LAGARGREERRLNSADLAITSLISTSEVHLAVSFGGVSSDVDRCCSVNCEAELLLHKLFDKRDPKICSRRNPIREQKRIPGQNSVRNL
jgi:hypothetical protein